jgi:hypothetical protein
LAWEDFQDAGCERDTESAATGALPAARGRGCLEGLDPCSLLSSSVARGGFGRARKKIPLGYCSRRRPSAERPRTSGTGDRLRANREHGKSKYSHHDNFFAGPPERCGRCTAKQDVDRGYVGEEKSDPPAAYVLAWEDFQDGGCRRDAEKRGNGCASGRERSGMPGRPRPLLSILIIGGEWRIRTHARKKIPPGYYSRRRPSAELSHTSGTEVKIRQTSSDGKEKTSRRAFFSCLVAQGRRQLR